MARMLLLTALNIPMARVEKTKKLRKLFKNKYFHMSKNITMKSRSNKLNKRQSMCELISLFESGSFIPGSGLTRRTVSKYESNKAQCSVWQQFSRVNGGTQRAASKKLYSVRRDVKFYVRYYVKSQVILHISIVLSI